MIADRRQSYPTADRLTVYDDRTRSRALRPMHRSAAVRVRSDEAFVDPDGASSSAIARVVSGCPSGALAFALQGQIDPIEQHQPPSIHPIVDGPYRAHGGIQVIGADGREYEIRERQTLCRCGQSRNKPFCDGSHWYAGFRDPLPPELADAPSFPWDDPQAAERGRKRYAEQRGRAVHDGEPSAATARSGQTRA